MTNAFTATLGCCSGGLGIPEQTTTTSTATATPSDPSGDFVYLYATQSDQRAFEYAADGDDTLWYGDFTRNLVNVLNDVRHLTYDQLLQAGSDPNATRQRHDKSRPLRRVASGHHQPHIQNAGYHCVVPERRFQR